MSEYEDLQKEVEVVVTELANSLPPGLIQQVITGIDLSVTQEQLFDNDQESLAAFRTLVLNRVLAELNVIKAQLAEPKLEVAKEIPGQLSLVK